MKRQIALLFALTFLVSGMATIAEETATDTENTEAAIVETVENEEFEWVAPFEDGEWMSIPEWNAEVYLPAGWLLSEVTENGFIAADSEETSTMTVTMEDFIIDETVETDETTATEETAATAETEEAAATEENAENEETVETTGPSAFETYLMNSVMEYALVTTGEREMAVITGEESVTVKFVQNDLLVTMEFAPATEGGIADSALSIAETFYVYETEEAVVDAETENTEAAAEEAAAE